MSKGRIERPKEGKVTMIARWALSCLLLYGAYTETGKWTLLTLVLLVMAEDARVLTYNLKRRRLQKFLEMCEKEM